MNLNILFPFLHRKNKLTENELIKVYSHPRSGTHFIEAFLGENFYPKINLNLKTITWGHWSNRMINKKGNPYGLLFGNHYFADKNKNDKQKIYIYRDGRAVAYSIWKTPNFINKDLSKLPFKEFLKTKIDWYGSPSVKDDKKYTIVEHWKLHVDSWLNLERNNKNVLIIKYEDLVEYPYKQYLKIHEKFFRNTLIIQPNDIKIINKPVGLLPNKAKINSWEEVFDKESLIYYHSIINTK